MRRFKKYLVILFLFFATCDIYAFWSEIDVSSTDNTGIVFQVNNFDYNAMLTPCDLATLIIDETFYNTYMVKDEFGNYDWKRDAYGDVLNYNEIKHLTPVDTIIKSDICYIVISHTYNLVWHGLPNKEYPLNWALMPVRLKYVENWAYGENRVVKTEDGQYFMARFYTITNPLLDRFGWDKIEPTIRTDFYCYSDTAVPNYSEPILENIVRSVEYDYYTYYQIGDEVNFFGERYIAVKNNIYSIPNISEWAWEEL